MKNIFRNLVIPGMVMAITLALFEPSATGETIKVVLKNITGRAVHFEVFDQVKGEKIPTERMTPSAVKIVEVRPDQGVGKIWYREYGRTRWTKVVVIQGDIVLMQAR